MPRRRALFWCCLLGCAPTSCALAGYDFGDYQRAGTADGGSTSTRQTTSATSEAGAAEGGQAGAATTANASGETASSAGAPDKHPIGPEPTTFGVGGGPSTETPEGGAGGGPAVCVPLTCADQALECGSAHDGCGKELDCGGCFWWFLECRENTCQFVE